MLLKRRWQKSHFTWGRTKAFQLKSNFSREKDIEIIKHEVKPEGKLFQVATTIKNVSDKEITVRAIVEIPEYTYSLGQYVLSTSPGKKIELQPNEVGEVRYASSDVTFHRSHGFDELLVHFEVIVRLK